MENYRFFVFVIQFPIVQSKLIVDRVLLIHQAVEAVGKVHLIPCPLTYNELWISTD